MLALILLTLASRCLADDREARLKAAFILNFAKFVEWPTARIVKGKPFNFCFIGIDRYRRSYVQEFEGKTVKGMTATVTLLNYTSPLENCHILFVRDLNQGQLAHLSSALAGRPILTIGEDEEFMAMGGMIRFYASQGKIRFEINPHTAMAAELSISSKLLHLATIRDSETGGKP